MTHRTLLFSVFCALSLTVACDESTPPEDDGSSDAATTGKADGFGCDPTGVACTPQCPESGELPSGAPCIPGTLDEDTCECVPLDDGDDGYDDGYDDGETCPPTGVVCSLECSDAGELPDGAPCEYGVWDDDACECVPEDGDGGDTGDDDDDDDAGDSGDSGDAGETGDEGCAPTGVVCTAECPESGELADGTPCESGEWDDDACECVPEPGGPECVPTGVACTADCPESGQLPGGVPCVPGNFDDETCECVPL